MDKDQFLQEVMRHCHEAEIKSDQPIPPQIRALIDRIDKRFDDVCCAHHFVPALLSVALILSNWKATDLGYSLNDLPPEEVQRRMQLVYKPLFDEGMNTIESIVTLIAAVTEITISICKSTNFSCPLDGTFHE